jgi:Uma2 family endonuclease
LWFFKGYQLKRGWLIADVSVCWPDQPVSEWFQASPMIAIEIVSEGNRAEEIDRKVGAYLQEGGAEVWVVYPATRTMNVFRKDETLRITDVYRCERMGVTVQLDSVLSGT